VNAVSWNHRFDQTVSQTGAVDDQAEPGRWFALRSSSVPFDYYPSTLTHDDYPDISPTGRSVDTIAVGAVLIAYNWPKTNVDRYRRVQRFVEFFPKITEFQKPPRHSKWREVNLAAQLPGWTRFEAAQAWLDSQASQATQASAESAPGFPQAVKLDGVVRSGATGVPAQNDACFTSSSFSGRSSRAGDVFRSQREWEAGSAGGCGFGGPNEHIVYVLVPSCAAPSILASWVGRARLHCIIVRPMFVRLSA
jgi:hypothetical protein